ncbi:MAG TPA: alpha amylase C-terminal domain-containing protein [Phycisphaerae bacterium]
MIVQSIFVLSSLLFCADHDNNVEWAGISHLPIYDRQPKCPLAGETFTAKFKTWHFDITSARARVFDGNVTWVDANWVANEGPYDVWAAQVPATGSNTISYYFEITDGTDTDYLSPIGMTEDAPTGDGWTLNFTTLDHAPLGATVATGGVVFRVWAPGASIARVAGQFNGWSTTSLPMTNTSGYWAKFVSGAVAGQEYKFVFNTPVLWKQDARERQRIGADQNSKIVNPDAYAWGDAAWQRPDFENLIIYELHVGSFSGLNDGVTHYPAKFRDAVDVHVDHLVSLGVTAVELMPISEFPGDFSWGYNLISPFGVEAVYGNPDDLRYLVDQCHQHGIAVLLDIVDNHLNFSDNYLWQYDGTQIYFANPAFNTPWGSQMDFTRPQVQDFYVDNLALWLEEYHVDGFRMDATYYMYPPNGGIGGWPLMQKLNDLVDRRYADRIMIAEQLPNNTGITNPTSTGGAGFDSQWYDAFNDNVRGAIFAAAFGDPNMFAVRDALASFAFPDKLDIVNYVESHDEAGALSGGARLAVQIDGSNPNSIYAKGRSKLGQGLAMFAPGIAMFLQGGEWRETNAFGDQFNQRIDWNKAITNAPFLQFFKDMIAARKQNAAFRARSSVNVHHVNDSANVIAFRRWTNSGNDIVVVANFSNNNFTSYSLGFPQPGNWDEILNSQALVYEGNGLGNAGHATASGPPLDGFAQSATIVLPQMGLLVFRYDPTPDLLGDFDDDGDIDLTDWATWYQCSIGNCPFGVSADLNGDGALNLADVALFQLAFTG